MILNAPFPTVCVECQRPVPRGFPISYDKTTLKIRHVQCSEERTSAPSPSTAVTHRPPAAAQGPHGAITVPVTPHPAPSPAPTSFPREEVSTARFPLPVDAIPLPAGRTFLPFQKEGIAFALARRGSLIAFDMGLGKTCTSLGILKAHPTAQHVLIVCPASLKTNWLLECKAWDVPLPVQIADKNFPKQGIVITNPDVLAKVPDRDWDLLILDESQMYKNPKSQRTRHVQKLAKRARRVVALSGTPIENAVIDLWPVLQILNPEEWDPAGFFKGKKVDAGEGAGFYRFARRYCDAKEVVVGSSVNPVTGERILKKVWDLKGSSNEAELGERLRATTMIRRLKKDVLEQLPAKRRQVLTLGIERTEDGECLDHEPLFEGLPSTLEECLELLHRSTLPEFRDFARTRHEQNLRKVPYAVQHVRDMLASGLEKIVVFAHHDSVLDALRTGLTEFFPALISGKTPVEKRQAEVDKFQEKSECKLFLGSLRAAGRGITLTASSHVVMVEADYNPSVNAQAEDRVHRIGQRESVLVHYIVQDGTLDAHLIRLVVAKQEVIQSVLEVS